MYRHPEKPLADLFSLVELSIQDIKYLYGSNTRQLLLDIKTLRVRLAAEGIGFLGRLHDLGDALLQGVENGSLPSVVGFRQKDGLPLFLRWPLLHVFDSHGVLKADFSAQAFADILQFCLLTKKVKGIVRSDEQARADMRLRATAHYELPTDTLALNLVRRHFHEVLTLMTLEPSDFHFGPGAVAEKLNGSQKAVSFSRYSELEELLPLASLLPRGPEVQATLLAAYTRAGRRVSRLVTVPKTLFKPRVIAIEPNTLMFYQQGLRLALERAIVTHTGGQVQFKDQSGQQDRAKLGSEDGSLATIDLSNASDSITLPLMRELLDSCPMGRLLLASRSTQCSDGDEVFDLNIYATMGNATTFPIESLLFWAICRSVTHDVTVFGDDIIVPSDCYDRCVRLLQTFGFGVNASKSFHQGSFRESCGGWFVKGINCTPVFLRELNSRNAVASLVATANQLFAVGWWNTAARLDSWCHSVYYRRIPVSPLGSELSYLSLWSFSSTAIRHPEKLTWSRKQSAFVAPCLRILPMKTDTCQDWYLYDRTLLAGAAEQRQRYTPRGARISVAQCKIA